MGEFDSPSPVYYAAITSVKTCQLNSDRIFNLQFKKRPTRITVSVEIAKKSFHNVICVTQLSVACIRGRPYMTSRAKEEGVHQAVTTCDVGEGEVQCCDVTF